jgi:serine/threonine protein kinase
MIGRVVKGKYKIYDEVGSGGFATVYLGRNMDTNEIVAIKVLSQQFTREARYVERFRREAGLAERLQDPNIVRILDHGIENGMHFLVMEFVEGLTLDEIIERKERLTLDEALSYVEQACRGLHAAFRAGVVHRDIKPANLMITPGGKVKIMDFGIARMESMAGLTQSGMFMGTPRYISPEMAKGSGADIRSDLYALGLLTYEMLVGKPPFDADNPWAVLRQQIESDPAPIRQIRPDVPEWLEAIILRAIAKDPAQRFQSPTEMLAALKERTPKPVHVPDQPPPPTSADATFVGAAARKRGASRGLILGLAGAAIVVALGLAAVFVFGIGGGEATATPTPTSALAQATEDTSTALPTVTPVVLVITNTPEDTDTPQPEPTNTSQPIAAPTDTPLPEPTDTPQPEPTDTPQPTVPPTQGPTNTPKPTAAPTSPPVSGRIAYSAGRTLHIVNVANGQDTVPPLGDMRQPDFRRDGAEVIADGLGSPASPVNINASTGAINRELTTFSDDYHPFWSPDATRFVYDSVHHGLGDNTKLYIQPVDNPRQEAEMGIGYNGFQIRGHSPVWAHDDTVLFTACDYWPGGSGGSKCGIYRIPSWGESRPALIHPGSTDMRANDNHGGQIVLTSQEEGNWEIYIMSIGGGAARNLSNSPASNDGLGTFSPDGKMVAFVSNRGGGWAVWAVKVDGTGLTKLFSLPAAPTAPWHEESISWGP